MNPDQNEPTFEASIAQVMQVLPPPIRQYLSQGKYSVVAKSLMTTYNLHIDQGGILEREIMLLLMGIENPDEFAASLASEAAISEEVIGQIMVDINQEIFVPLHNQMKSGGGNMPPPPKSVMPAPRHLQQVNVVPQSYAPPLQSPRYFHSEIEMALSRPRPVQSSSRDAGVPAANPQQSSPAPAAPQGQIGNNRLLEDHEEPHIGFNKIQIPAHDSPRTLPPPPNLPGVFPPSVAPRVEHPMASSPQSGIPLAPLASRQDSIAAKPYSTDPYREPIE